MISSENAVNYGFFTGGLGIHYGIERMGAMAVPSGVGNTERQLESCRTSVSQFCIVRPLMPFILQKLPKAKA